MTAVQTFLRVTALQLGIKILAALAFWMVGRWIIVRVIRLAQAGMDRKQLDPTLTGYLGTILRVVLTIALVIGILGYFGVQTTSFAALLAGAGLAIGAAWSGLLGNFAAGAFMLVLRPFKVGDVISVAGVTGKVHDLGLFATTLVTPDHVMTLVGNGKVFSESIQNFSALPVRRVDRTAQLSGAVDPLEACAKLREAVAQIPNVVASPPPEVNLLDLTLLGPVIAVRPYCRNEHYWQVYFDTNEAIVRTAKDAGWPAPTPVSVTRVQQIG
jgi:small conductance mechanosensitive channel